MDFIKGIDVSAIQGNIDWPAVAAAGIKFCIMRCGVGNNAKDRLYDANIAGAKAVGIKVMAYHFVYPLPTTAAQPTRDPKLQAKMHVEWAKGELAACDLEWPVPPDWAKWGCSAAQVLQWTIDYLEEYERLSGIRPVLYTDPDFSQHVNFPASFGEKYKLWIASYRPTPTIPKPWTDWALWQTAGGTEKLPVTNVPVDSDCAKDLSIWDTVPTTVEVEPVPPTVPSTPNPIPIKTITPPVIDIVDKTGNFWTDIASLFSKLFK